MNTAFENDKVEFYTFPVGSYACNCSVFVHKESREAIIVDPGNDFSYLTNLIEKNHWNVKSFLHTHAHFDHIGASNELRQHTQGKICLHKADQFLYDYLPQQGLFFGQKVGAPGAIDHYIEDQEEFLLTKNSPEKITAIYTPGHTPGSTSFYTEHFGMPLLLSGDTLFQGSIGRTDLPGGDGEQIITSIKNRLLTLPDETLIIAGHGGHTNIYNEKKFNPFLC